MFKKINSTLLFWLLLLLSFSLIIAVKFSPLKDMSTSQIIIFSWFHYGFELGELVFDLSVGYIISCIFYYIVVYLPEQKKRNGAMLIVESRISKILDYMSITLNYIIYKHEITLTHDNHLMLEEFQKITSLDESQNMNFYYQYYSKSANNRTLCNTGVYNEKSLLIDQRIKIKEIIDNLFNIPVITSVEHDLLVILEEINNCGLFKQVFIISTEPNVNTPELGKELFNYYLLYKKLGKYIEPTKFSFNQDSVECWWDIDIIKGSRQYTKPIIKQ